MIVAIILVPKFSEIAITAPSKFLAPSDFITSGSSILAHIRMIPCLRFPEFFPWNCPPQPLHIPDFSNPSARCFPKFPKPNTAYCFLIFCSYPTMILFSGNSLVNSFGFFFPPNTNAIVIGPIRPTYIKLITTSLLPNPRLGVRFPKAPLYQLLILPHITIQEILPRFKYRKHCHSRRQKQKCKHYHCKARPKILHEIVPKTLCITSPIDNRHTCQNEHCRSRSLDTAGRSCRVIPMNIKIHDKNLLPAVNPS